MESRHPEISPAVMLTVGTRLGKSVFMDSHAAENVFFLSLQGVIDRFDAHHDGMIHISDLVAPGAKTASRINSLADERRLNNVQSLVPVQGWDWVRILH